MRGGSGAANATNEWVSGEGVWGRRVRIGGANGAHNVGDGGARNERDGSSHSGTHDGGAHSSGDGGFRDVGGGKFWAWGDVRDVRVRAYS